MLYLPLVSLANGVRFRNKADVVVGKGDRRDRGKCDSRHTQTLE